MKNRLHSLARKPWAVPTAFGLLLAVGVLLGVGVGHLVKHRQQPAPPPVAEAPPVVEAPEQLLPPPIAAAIPPVAEEIPPPPPYHVEDDINGPAEVPPPPPVVETAPPAPEPPVKTKGQPAWLRYAVPGHHAAGRPMIVVVIDDLGLDKRRTRRAIDLPAPLTLSFMTYAEDLPALTASAHEHGHELLVHMPMQAMSAHFSAGPNALEVGMPPQELHQRIDWGLSRFTGYVGVNNHMGSRFTADPAGMAVVMQDIKQRGLLFLDSVTTDHSAAPEAARRQNIPFAQRQVFLDNEQTLDSIRQQLTKTEAIAKKHGQAIAIGHPHDATLAALTAWLPTLEAKGFAIVPLTTLVKENRQ